MFREIYERVFLGWQLVVFNVFESCVTWSVYEHNCHFFQKTRDLLCCGLINIHF